jgi:hypothetical protein
LQALDLPEPRGDLFGEPVGEIGVSRVTREIVEVEYRDAVG